MLPDRVSNPGPLTYESGALPIALRGPAHAATGKLSLSTRSGGGVVDNALDYQSRGRKIDPPLLRSFG